VLLAGLPDYELHALLAARPLPALTARTVTDRVELFGVVRQVRRQGWSLVNQELEEGLVSLAAPITDRSGRTIAAMNLSGQANRTPPEVMVERFLPRLLEAAASISRMLRMKS